MPEVTINKAKAEGRLAVDIVETTGDLVIIAPIAGTTPSEMHISVTDDTVTIKGERKAPEVSGKEKVFTQECFWGKFSRQIILPDNVDIEKMNASFKDGILRITIPKVSKGGPREISINLEV